MLEDIAIILMSSGTINVSGTNDPTISPPPPIQRSLFTRSSSSFSYARAMAADKTRTKKWAPKTFNGCLTCKRRRIKCDEGKPACQRCIKSNIKCSGYAPPKIRLFEPGSSASSSSSSSSSTTIAATPTPLTEEAATATNPTTGIPVPDPCKLPTSEEPSFQSYPQTCPHPRELSVAPNFGTEDEYRSFQFFLEKTSDLISIYSQPYLWTVLLPQATWHQPAIKHSIIALASLHQCLTMVGPNSQRANHNFMFHYNRAIRALVADKPPIDIVLAACVIFWALENFNGSGQAAFDHMKAAVKILGEWKAKRRPNDPTDDLISTYIEPTIRDGVKFASKYRIEELQSQISALSLTTRDVRIMNISYPAFNTLEKAGEYLANCINDILEALKASPFKPGPELVESIEELDARLYKWMNLFQNLTATGPVNIRRMLIVHNVAANILLDQLKTQVRAAGLTESLTEEPHRCRFSFTVLEVEDMMKGHSSEESCTEQHSPSLGFIPPIFLAATAAPKVEIRRRAISALRILNIVEGPWNTDVALQIAEGMLEIAQECSIPPVEVELRHMNFELDVEAHTMNMRWEPEDQRFQNARFAREIQGSGVNWSESQSLPGLIKNFGYRFTSL